MQLSLTVRKIFPRASALLAAILLCATLAPAQSDTPKEPTPADLAGIAHIAIRVQGHRRLRRLLP